MELARYEAGLRKVEKGLVIFTWIVFSLLTLMIVADVFLRAVFNAPIPASAEATELFMPYIVFLPLAYTLITGQHVRVSILAGRVPSRAQWSFELLANIIGFIFFAMLTWWSWIQFWESFIIREEMLAALRLPWWVGKFALPIGSLLICLEFLMQVIMTFAKRVRR